MARRFNKTGLDISHKNVLQIILSFVYKLSTNLATAIKLNSFELKL